MTGLALQFRHATRADIDAVVALVESAYRGDASRAGWTTEADLLDGRRTDADDIAACIERDRSRILLGVQTTSGESGSPPDNASDSAQAVVQLVACAHVSMEDGAGYFGMFSVHPTLQGSGIGKAMLAEAERIARDEWRLPCMRMTVIDVRNELIGFYQRRGYRRTGVLKPFPYGDERFGRPKRDDLRFEVLEKVL